MNIIFLDFDGVLNSLRTVYAHGPMKGWCGDRWDHLDPIAVNLVRRLCEDHNAKIVISSTWRKLYDIEEFRLQFKTLFDWDIPIIGVTPNSNSGHRGDEISRWLVDSGHLGEIKNCVILDDDSDFNPEQPFVHINGHHGLSVFDYHRAIVYLDPSNEAAKKFLENYKDYE